MMTNAEAEHRFPPASSLCPPMPCDRNIIEVRRVTAPAADSFGNADRTGADRCGPFFRLIKAVSIDERLIQAP